MTKPLTKESFERLLNWLDPDDRTQAADKYETIRGGLVKMFVSRSCHEAEDLADLTIDRVVHKLEDIEAGYKGSPARFFYGVAQKVYLERLRRTFVPLEEVDTIVKIEKDISLQHACLAKCLAKLSDKHKRTILEYYRGDASTKIALRRNLAKEMGIDVNTLRIRVCRIKASLSKCAQNCLENSVR